MKLTWLGHSGFRVEFGAARILIDPFLTGNPKFTGDAMEVSADCTHVLLTHGHNDHTGDTLEICHRTGAQLVGSAEVCNWFESQGVKDVNPGNHGGTVDCGGFTVSFVNALHSSSVITEQGMVYLGNPLGLIVTAPGEPVLYHMGDTDIFGDMALINEIHQPEVGIVPIGDRYTMGSRAAAMACTRFFNFRRIVPSHYGTFPGLDQNPDAFIAALGDQGSRVEVATVGESFDA